MVKKAFSGRALFLTTMSGEDFPSLADADAVRKYFVKRVPLDKKNKRVQAKKGIPANQKTERKGSGKN